MSLLTPNRSIFISYGVARISRAEAWLETQQGEVVLVAPTPDAADDFAYRLTRSRAGAFGLHRFTLGQLASVLATSHLAAERRVAMPPLGFEALVARAVHLVRASSGLEYFEPVANRPGFVSAVSRTLRELRQENVTRERLSEIGPAGRDLAEVLRTFILEMEKQYLSDFSLLLETATRVASERKDRLVGIPLLLLDPRPQMELERSFLRAIIEASPSCCATALTQDADSISWLEGTLHSPAQSLDAQNPRTQLQRIRRSLFVSSAPEAGEDDSSFEFFSAPGEGRESVEIARRVLKLADEGLRFDQMGVFLRNHELYQPQLEEAFARAGIPAYFSRGVRRPDPAGRAFLSLLECALERFSASRFAEYLSLGQVPDLSEEGLSPPREIPWVAPTREGQLLFKTVEVPPESTEQERLDERQAGGNLRAPFRWERLLIDASVIGGYSRWRRRLEGLERELQIKLEGCAEEDPNRLFYREQLTRLKYLSRFVLPLIDRLERFPERAQWSEWLKHLKELAAQALRSPESVLGVLADLEPMGNVGPLTLTEVREVLHRRLLFLRSEPPKHRYGRVFVGQLEEGSARTFEVVFLPGVAEGIFPRKIFEDPLLQDSAREALGIPKTVETAASEERHLLQVGVAAAEERFVASYPRMDLRQGRARVPSLYALEILRAASGRLPDLQQLQREKEDGSGRRLGWPAPPDEQDAIDASEFDLARLGPLLHGRRPEKKGNGGALYLMKVNPWLARSLRARFKRWGNAWSDDDGLVAARDPGTQPLVGEHRLHRRSYSPTALQHFAACPYRFFLYALQRLQTRQRIDTIEKMDPLVRGSLIHEIQFEFFRALQEGGISGRERTVERALAALDDVIARVSEAYMEDLAPAIPQIWRGEVEELRVDLRSWVREALEEEADWEPLHWELSFGLPLEGRRDPHSKESEAVLDSGRRFRGSIDLVELNRSTGKLRVIDHKTGKAPWPKPSSVGGGEVLQPLIYAVVAEALLGRPVVEGQLYYCTRRGGFEKHHFPLGRDSRARLLAVLEAVDAFLEESFLPAAPKAKACTYCDYRIVCGPYEEMRVRRKHPGPLKRLEKIRRLP